MTGKVCIVTGVSEGIGRATAIGLARLGAQVIGVCRNRKRALDLAQVIDALPGSIDFEFADLSLLAEAQDVSKRILKRCDSIDVLINNAGAVFESYAKTSEGFEQTFALNHLAYFVVTHNLLDRLKSSGPARIINVASQAHRVGPLDFNNLQAETHYSAKLAYGRSKLANIYFTLGLHARLQGTVVTANCLHPGVIGSKFWKPKKSPINFVGAALWVIDKLATPLMATPKSGAKTSIYLATEPGLDQTSGEYFIDSQPARGRSFCYDQAAAEKLWTLTEEFTAPYLD